MSNEIKHHENLIQIAKRDDMPMLKSWVVRAIGIVLALLVCSVVILLLTGYNPLQVYKAMFDGAFGSARKRWYLLHNLAMLLSISLAVTPAFKMKFWNIGAEGQTLVGGLAAAGMMIYFGNMIPSVLLIPLMLVVSMIAGMIWGIIPAYFKARFNTNETLFTLMMNYVAMQLISFFIVFWENPKDSNHIGIINSNTMGGWLPSIFGQKYMLNIIIVAVITIGM
ncbi:MAG: ABC transporter permease, partial [Clostridia bacterium]|nr:ABC transporter permease [Clostridia bacterium]